MIDPAFTAPDDSPRTVARPTLTIVPAVSLEDLTPEVPETKKLLPHVPDIELGDPPDFLGDIHLDTRFTAQPHWLTDAKGEPFTFRLNPNLSRVISIIVESNATPYRTKSDFFRDAAYYLARTVRDLINLKDQRLDSLLQEADLRAESDYEARLQEEVIGFEHDLSDAVIGCLERGALGEASRKVAAFWERTNNIEIPHRRKAHQDAMTDSPLISAVLKLASAHGLAVPTGLLAPTPAQQAAV